MQRAQNQREHGRAEDRVQRQQAPQLTGLGEADEEPVVRVELERDSKGAATSTAGVTTAG